MECHTVHHSRSSERLFLGPCGLEARLFIPLSPVRCCTHGGQPSAVWVTLRGGFCLPGLSETCIENERTMLQGLGQDETLCLVQEQSLEPGLLSHGNGARVVQGPCFER